MSQSQSRLETGEHRKGYTGSSSRIRGQGRSAVEAA